jgi:phosphate starvation-inducible PhoH-like protein
MKKNSRRRAVAGKHARVGSREIEIEDPSFLVAFLGIEREHIALMESSLDVCIGSRGNRVLIQGKDEGVDKAVRVIRRFQAIHRMGRGTEPGELSRIVHTMIDDPDLPVEEISNDVILHAPGRRVIAPKSPGQKIYVDAMRAHDVVFSIGPAGTGKTYLAVAVALAYLARKQYRRIILTRPAVEAGEKLGYLPGDLIEKVNPYLRPLYDALNDMMDIEKSQGLLEKGVIEVAPLAFMRGRTLNSSFIILDEAQNTSIAQMKMFLTRLGFDSKAVIAGDITQIDLPAETRSGLVDANELLQGIPGMAFCYFTEKDVVRHPLVQEIIRRYDERP